MLSFKLVLKYYIHVYYENIIIICNNLIHQASIFSPKLPNHFGFLTIHLYGIKIDKL